MFSDRLVPTPPERPSSLGSSSRGGRKHTRRLKTAWRQAQGHNPGEARSWLTSYGYPLPPSSAEQAATAAKQAAAAPVPTSTASTRYAEPASPRPNPNLVIWAELRSAWGHWNGCPNCYCHSDAIRVETSLGWRVVRECHVCHLQFKPYDRAV